MKSYIQYIVVLLIALTPVFGIVEFFNSIGISFPVDMIAIKLVKDVLIIVLILFSIIRILLTNRISKEVFFALLALFSITTLSFFMNRSGLFVGLAGIRWSLPIFLALVLNKSIKNDTIIKLSHILAYIVCLNLFLQIIQMFYMPPIRGLNFLGLSGRVAGYFAFPSSAGILASFTYFFVKYFSSFGTKQKKLFLAICILSAFISMSSTGIAILSLLIFLPPFIKIKSSLKYIYLLFFLVLIIGVSLNIDTITGRHEGASANSFITRLEIFKRIIGQSQLLSTRFGEATNSAVGLSNRDFQLGKEVFISDSFYTSFLSNYGILFSIFCFFYLLLKAFKIYHSQLLDLKIFFLIALLSGIPLIISEIFPINILIAVLIAFYRNRYSNALA